MLSIEVKERGQRFAICVKNEGELGVKLAAVVGIDGALAAVMHFAIQGGPDASAYSAEVMGQALSAVCTFNN